VQRPYDGGQLGRQPEEKLPFRAEFLEEFGLEIRRHEVGHLQAFERDLGAEGLVEGAIDDAEAALGDDTVHPKL